MQLNLGAQRRAHWGASGAILGCGLVGLLLWGFPADPDAEFSKLRVLGVFLVFLYASGCIFKWGEIFSKLLRTDSLAPLSSLALGSVAAAAVVALFGHLGCLGASWDLFEIFLLSASLLLAAFLPPKKEINSQNQDSMPAIYIAMGVFFVCVGFRLLIATSAHGTSDPFIYHLLAPRQWWEAGRIIVSPTLPLSFQATYWEYLIAWGNVLFAAHPNRGLIEVHLFGQFLHILFGLGGAGLALYFIVRQLGLPRMAAWVCALVGISSLELWPITWLAKNDLGAMFWSLTALNFLMNSRNFSTVRRWSLAGLFAGFGMAAKWNMALMLLPVFSLLCFFEIFSKERSARKQVIAAVVIGALIAFIATMPITLRNILLTGNPFFPFFDQLFPSPYLTANLKQLASETLGSANRLSAFFSTFLLLLKDNKFSFGILFFPVLAFTRRNDTPRKLGVLLLGAGVAYFLYSLRNNPNGFMRWTGPSLLLVPALGCACLCLFSERVVERFFPKNTSLLLNGFCVALSLGLLALHLYWDKLFILTAIHGALPNVVIRDSRMHMGAASKAWLRLNAKPSELIFSSGDNQIYYLSGFNVRIVSEEPALSARLNGIDDPKAALALLRAEGGKYLLDTEHWAAPFWGRSAWMLNVLISEHKDSIVFQGSESKVVDLEKLEKDVLSSAK